MSKKLGQYRYEYLNLTDTIVLRAIATKTNKVITACAYPKGGNNAIEIDYAHEYVHEKARKWAIENQYESEQND